jgi:YHS domain-containing protein
MKVQSKMNCAETNQSLRIDHAGKAEWRRRMMNRFHRISLVVMLVVLLLIPPFAFAEELKTRPANPREIGKKAWCPIMDFNFEVKAGTPVIDYKGKSFYFCCEGCPQEFRKDPDKYLAQTEFRERRPTPGEIGKEANCTVMKQKIKIDANTPVIDYHGKSFYFCCPGCPSEFKKDPDKYTTP